jgi:hypothetical protein
MLDRWHADAIWWSFPLTSVVSVVLASAYYRWGGWRNLRLGIAEVRPGPLAGDATKEAATTSIAASTSAPTT